MWLGLCVLYFAVLNLYFVKGGHWKSCCRGHYTNRLYCMHPWTNWCWADSVHWGSLTLHFCVCMCVWVSVFGPLTRVLPVTAPLIRGFSLLLMSADRIGLPCQRITRAHTHARGLAHTLLCTHKHTHAYHWETRCPGPSASRQRVLNVPVLHL